MTLHTAACGVSARITLALRHPLFILLFPLGCGAFIATGWMLGKGQAFLLILTTALSVLASWQASMVMLKQGQDAGEVE